MSFNVIYYINIACPTIGKSLEMVDKYVAHGAKALQIDLPSRDPYEETPLVKKMMLDSLDRNGNYDVYMDAVCEIRRRHPDLELHVVVYTDVVDSIGIEKFVAFGKEIRVASFMIPFNRREIWEYIERSGIPDMKVILNSLPDDEIAAAVETCERGYQSIVSLRNRKPGESDRPGCETWAGRYSYARKAGITAPIVSVFGIKTKEALQEIKDSGADGAIIGNVLMNLWDDEPALWALFDQFQSLYE